MKCEVFVSEECQQKRAQPFIPGPERKRLEHNTLEQQKCLRHFSHVVLVVASLWSAFFNMCASGSDIVAKVADWALQIWS